jgi:hypothetical protein
MTMDRRKAAAVINSGADPEYVKLLDDIAALPTHDGADPRPEMARLLERLQNFQRDFSAREAARVAAIARIPVADAAALGPLAHIAADGTVSQAPVSHDTPEKREDGAVRHEAGADTYTSTRAAARALMAQRAGRG